MNLVVKNKGSKDDNCISGIFINFEKASDTVDYQILKQRLYYYSIKKCRSCLFHIYMIHNNLHLVIILNELAKTWIHQGPTHVLF